MYGARSSCQSRSRSLFLCHRSEEIVSEKLSQQLRDTACEAAEVALNQARLAPQQSPLLPRTCLASGPPPLLLPSPTPGVSPPPLPAHLSHQHLKGQVMTHLHQEASPWGQDSGLVHLYENKQTNKKTQKT